MLKRKRHRFEGELGELGELGVEPSYEQLEETNRSLASQLEEKDLLYKKARMSIDLGTRQMKRLARELVEKTDQLNILDDLLQERVVINRSLLDDKERDICIICMNSIANMVCVPCGHANYCGICAHQLDHCPICRKIIGDVYRFYR